VIFLFGLQSFVFSSLVPLPGVFPYLFILVLEIHLVYFGNWNPSCCFFSPSASIQEGLQVSGVQNLVISDYPA
jgi:hypothetical protein